MTIGNLCSEIDSRIAQFEEGNAILGVRSLSLRSPRILGVFTGQGAQWPAMGRELLMASPYVHHIIAVLDLSLAELPSSDRPLWSIKAELMADGSTSRLADAAVSQPLCTAVQIALVDLLRSSGIQLQAVVGHSSGVLISPILLINLVIFRLLIFYQERLEQRTLLAISQHTMRYELHIIGASTRSSLGHQPEKMGPCWL